HGVDSIRFKEGRDNPARAFIIPRLPGRCNGPMMPEAYPKPVRNISIRHTRYIPDTLIAVCPWGAKSRTEPYRASGKKGARRGREEVVLKKKIYYKLNIHFSHRPRFASFT